MLLKREDWNCDGGLGMGTNNYICGKLPDILDMPDRIGINATVDRKFTEEFLENSLGFVVPFDNSFIEGGGLERHATQATLILNYDLPDSGISFSTITGYNENKQQTVTDQTQQDSSDIPNFLFGIVPNVRPLRKLAVPYRHL